MKVRFEQGSQRVEILLEDGDEHDHIIEALRRYRYFVSDELASTIEELHTGLNDNLWSPGIVNSRIDDVRYHTTILATVNKMLEQIDQPVPKD